MSVVAEMGKARAVPRLLSHPCGMLRGVIDATFLLCCQEVHRAVIRQALVRKPPPRVIFAPRRRSPMLLRLQTADHIRRASPVGEP